MTTKVPLPPSLLYPVEVIELLEPLGASVKRRQPLIKFKYWNLVPDGVASEEDGEELPLVRKEFYGTFESPIDGTLVSCELRKGDRVNDSSTTVLEIAEACDHSVQYGGLCAICGQAVDETDYMGYSDTARAPIAMSHDSQGLTVSLEEAERIETRSTERLLADKRLILVVDLDQTVIHASVNPEIGRWLADAESPNHELVRDVRGFSLKERNAPGDREQTCWYYVKLRPGLSEFLEEMSAKYEMHIYTMATKNYALEIAKIIDPTGKYFADRILSRDASGSLLHKDLRRLFPVTTNMVTVIDDRGDVWNWSPNLIRVAPYLFWSDTGDINSQFLPHRAGLLTPDQSENKDEGGVDNDRELVNIGSALSILHKDFYDIYDIDSDIIPDVGRILPGLKSKVFDKCVFLFSGFFPMGTNLDNAEIVQWVRSFGAVVLADFLPSVTHVISKNAGTLKARQAAGHGKLVVSKEWIFACLEKWEHLPEEPFIIDVRAPIPIEEEIAVAEEDAEDEMDKNIAEGFMRSLSRGDMNWSEVDEELKELLSSDDDSADEEGEEAVEDEEDEMVNDAKDGNDLIVDQSSQNGTVGGKKPPGETHEPLDPRSQHQTDLKRKRSESDIETDFSNKNAGHAQPENTEAIGGAGSADSESEKKNENEDDLYKDFDDNWD